jgi:hypothetical protein
LNRNGVAGDRQPGFVAVARRDSGVGAAPSRANALTFSIQTGGNADLTTASVNSTTAVFSGTPADDNPTGTPSDQYTVKVIVTDTGVTEQSL